MQKARRAVRRRHQKWWWKVRRTRLQALTPPTLMHVANNSFQACGGGVLASQQWRVCASAAARLHRMLALICIQAPVAKECVDLVNEHDDDAAAARDLGGERKDRSRELVAVAKPFAEDRRCRDVEQRRADVARKGLCGTPASATT